MKKYGSSSFFGTGKKSTVIDLSCPSSTLSMSNPFYLVLNKNDGAKIAVSFVTTKSLHHFLYFISSSYYLLSRNILRHCWHHQILPSPPTISSCSLYQVSTGTCDTQVPGPCEYLFVYLSSSSLG